MDSLLSSLLSFLLLYKYVALFAVAFSAAIIIPLPTDMVLVAIGAFSYQHYFSFWISVAVTVIAEVAGDLIDYSLSKRYAHVVIREKYVRKYSFFTRLEDSFRKYTGLTIFLTRFVGILSPLTNFLSGFEKIKVRIFVLYDFLGNLVDTLALLSVGYLIGDNWESISDKLSLVTEVLAAVIIVFFIYRIFGKKNKKTEDEKPPISG